jgi:hypothetical protein
MLTLLTLLTRLVAWFRPGPGDGLVGTEGQRPLPATLQDRLRIIPQQMVVCRDVDRGWAELAREELAPGAAAGLRDHLACCERCATVYATLEAAVLEPPRPLPGTLTFRLHGVPRSRPAKARVPAFIRDIRYAAAASYLGALLVMFVVGNPVQAGARGMETVRPPVEGMIDQVQTTGAHWWQALDQWQGAVRREAGQEFQRRRHAVATAQQQRWHDWQQQMESLFSAVRSRMVPDEGHDGGADNAPGAADGGAAA